MKTTFAIITLLLSTPLANAQCSLSLTGIDFVWCQPCNGNAFSFISNGTPPYIYNWSTGDTIANVTGLCAGTYILSITDSLGCVATDSVTISQIGASMSVSASSTAASCSTCCDACITTNPLGGCIPFTFAWSPSDPNTPPCSACAGTTYTVTVTDACGCTIVDSITPDTVPIGTGIIIPLKEAVISIHPNPFTQTATITLQGIELPATLTIYDNLGRAIRQETITQSTHTIHRQNLSGGIYHYRITNHTGKLVISSP